ncbi:MAG: phage tail tube protein, partial [Chloroflexota bacterium]
MPIARWVGIGFEDTFGESASLKYVIDPTRVSLDSPSDPFIRYAGASGRGNRAIVPGAYIPEGDIEAAVDTHHGGALFRALIPGISYQQQAGNKGDSTTLDSDASAGDSTLSVDDESSFEEDDIIQIGADFGGAELAKVTSVSMGSLEIDVPLLRDHSSGDDVTIITDGPYDHFFDIGSDVAEIPSMTVRTLKDFDEQRFLGTVVSQLGISFGFNELVTLTASLVASKDGSGSASELPDENDASKLVTDPYAGPHLTTADLEHTDGGSDKDILPYIRSAEFTLNNNVSGEDGMRAGSRFPVEFRARSLEVTGQLTLVFSNRDQYEDFWGSSDEPSEDTTVPRNIVLKWSKGSDNSLEILLFNAYLTAPASEVSGRDQLVQTLEYESIQPGPFDSA